MDPAAIATQLKGYRAVIDTSAISNGLNVSPGTSIGEHLYGAAPNKLLALTDSFTAVAIHHFDQVSELLRLTTPDVLPEVIEENNALIGQLANYHLIYNRNMRERGAKWKNLTSEHESGLLNLEKLTTRIQLLNAQLRAYEVAMHWESVVPDVLLNLARRHSKDLIKRSIREHAHLDNPISVGMRLETDQKLVAYSFYTGRMEPVALITKDRGLMALAKRIGEYFLSPLARGSPTISPRRKISVYSTITDDFFPVYSSTLAKQKEVLKTLEGLTVRDARGREV